VRFAKPGTRLSSVASFKRIRGFHAEKLQSFVTNYINENMRDSITPEMAVNYAVNLTHSQSANLGEIIYLMEDPTRIKSKLL
jgi:hypothetical protein